MAPLRGLFTMMLLSSSAALSISRPPISRKQVVEWMRVNSSYAAQVKGCSVLSVDSSKKAMQDEAAQEGVIEAIATAMDRFPEDKFLVTRCTMVLSSVILFNRNNGLQAGRLGALNHTIHIYKQNMDDPEVMGLGGAIGAYFDFVDENRRIAAELGGIQAIIQNIKNHFHGKYSEWSYNPVKQSLFALSSGCWVNQDICVKEGFPELAVKLMREHGHEDKIAEETQQATKALMFKSNENREHLADLGVMDSMVHVLQANPHDRGALDLTCENFAWLVGPAMMYGPTGLLEKRDFSQHIQAKALESGALEAVVQVVTGGQEMHHKEHSAFNFDIDTSYNVNKDCFFALARLGHQNPEAQAALWKAGVQDTVLADLSKHPKDVKEVWAGCSLWHEVEDVDRSKGLLSNLTVPCKFLGNINA